MRKLLTAITGLLAAGAAITAVALAQTPSPTTVVVKATVTPNKAGTKAHPQAVKLKVHVDWNTPGDSQKPIVQTAKVLYPKGSLFQGGKYPSCSETVLNRSGPTKCPKGSIIGKGTGSAHADTVITHPHITVVNGEVFLYTVLDNPARVQAPVPAVIHKLSGSKWAYEMDITVPQVLQVVAGVPITLYTVDITAGSTSKPILATTSCPPSHKWPYSVTTSYDTGTSSGYEDSIPCK
jgi:hypothetical protein